MIHDILSEKPRIELIQADCMEVMAGIRDKAFRLAVVDPPYGKTDVTRGKTGFGTGSDFNRKELTHKMKKWDKPDKGYFWELFRISQNQIIWGGNYFSSVIGADSNCWIVWDKMNGNNPLADVELAWTSFTRVSDIVRIFWCGSHAHRKEKIIHINQKPVALYRWLLTNYAKQGDTILDTHLGSGSSAIAAWELGFDFLGIELDSDYYAAAKHRIQERLRQPFLPLQEKERMEQRALL